MSVEPSGDRRRRGRLGLRRACLALAAATLALGLAELALRALRRVEPDGSEEVLGAELPPRPLLHGPDSPVLLDPLTPVAAAGGSLARADLWGFLRLDPVLGFAPQEGVRSPHGWWQSNQLGARARSETTSRIPAGKGRLLVLGESFAQGHMLRQEEVWPEVLAASDPHLDVVNLAVDGYGMGQALLRFEAVEPRLDYDTVLLLFVPEADLWRDVNTLRQLDEPSWQMVMVPRFELAAGRLSLVAPLYRDGLDLYRRNRPLPEPALDRFLRAHDRLYQPARYAPVAGLHRALLLRLMERAREVAWRRRFDSHLLEPESEAMQVTGAIFERLQSVARRRGAQVVLLVLPIEQHWFTPGENRPVASWRRMVDFVCARVERCVDMLPPLQSLPRGEVDRAFDDWHFGPRANRHIAAIVAGELRRLQVPRR
jgi:hypothetical protein